LHGDISKYEKVLKLSKDYGIKVLHIGADILPKGGGILPQQKKFINGYLKEFYRQCSESGIQVLAFFGNDDIYSRKRYFKKYASLLDETPVEIDGYTFSAYGFCPDYPFGLKTACKLDRIGWKCPDAYLGPPVDIGPQGFEEIKDTDTYFKNKGTIESDLKALQGGSKAVVAIHCPPDGVDLDVCQDGRRVGSRAVYDWALNTQPKLILSGHIHESPTIGGKWMAYIGRTLVIQPGQQRTKTTYVILKIEDDKINIMKYDC
jgi:Icc-related predicted phosphoesterase